MIKTISLTANQETAVKIKGGSFCLIENRGTSIVYASKHPNVIASEDNVIAIDSASSKILENATKLSDSGVMQGTIYLVTDSDGAVEVRTATTTDSFKSKQRGGGEGSGGGVTDTYTKAVIDAKLSKKADEEVVNQALDNKIDKDGNKVLSDNNYTNDARTKLESLENYDDTQVKTDIINLQTSKANADEVYTIAQVNSAIATEVAKIVAESPESLDTLKEISTWIETHEESAAAMNAKIQENTTDIAEVQNGKVNKTDNYAINITTATEAYCVFKFAPNKRFSAKFLICVNNANRYGDIFINFCFDTAKIKKYILDDKTTISVIKAEDNSVHVAINTGIYGTATYFGTISDVEAFASSELPTGTEISLTEL